MFEVCGCVGDIASRIIIFLVSGLECFMPAKRVEAGSQMSALNYISLTQTCGVGVGGETAQMLYL